MQNKPFSCVVTASLSLLLCLTGVCAEANSASLISELSTNASQDAINKVVEALSNNRFPHDNDQLQNAIVAFLTSTNRGHRELAWNALATNPIASLNSYLSEELEEPTSFASHAFVAAISNANDPSIKVQLLEIALARNDPVTQAYDIHTVWNLAYQIDPVFTTATLLEYFTPPKRKQGDIDDLSAVTLVGLLGNVATNRDLVASLLPHIMDFVVAGATNTPLKLGAPTTAQYRVNKAIENLLLQQKTPVAESALLVFADADTPDFYEAARTNEYTQLKQNPWLITSFNWGYFLTPLNQAESDNLTYMITNHFKLAPLDYLRFTNAIDLIKGWSLVLPENQYYCFNLAYHYHQSSSNWLSRDTLITCSNYLNSIVQEQTHLTDSLIASLEDVLGYSDTNGYLRQSLAEVTSVFGPDMTKPKLLGDASIPFYAALPGIMPSKATDTDNLDAPTDAAFLINGEMNRRALMLFAITKYLRSTHTVPTNVLPLSTLDRDVDKIIRSSCLPITTKVTTSPHWSNLVAKMALQQINMKGIQCFSVKVKQRELSFLTCSYHERLEIAVENGTAFDIDWIGSIPLPLVIALERQPRLLDLTDESLAMHDIKRQLSCALAPYDDLDLVMGAGGSISLLEMAALHPNVPWKDIEDGIAIQINKSGYLWSQPAFYNDIYHLKDRTLPDVFKTDAAFQTAFGQCTNDYVKAIEFRELGRMIDQLKETANGLDTDQNFGNFLNNVGTVLFSGFTKSAPNQKVVYKNSVIQAINQLIDQHNAMSQDWISLSWVLPTDFHEMLAISSTQMLFDPEMSNFMETVNLTTTNYSSHYVGTFQQKLDLPPLVIYWLKRALQIDPYFMSRNHLDLFATQDYAERLSRAFYTVPMANDRAAIVESSLQKAGILPFAYSIAQNDIKKLYTTPFEKTRLGLVYKAEIEALQAANEYLQPGKDGNFHLLISEPWPQYPGLPILMYPASSNFLSQAVSNYSAAVNNADASAQVAIDKIQVSIIAHSKPADNWSFGITYGSDGTSGGTFGFNFTYDNFGINGSFQAGNVFNLGASFNGIPIPGSISFPLNGSSQVPDSSDYGAAQNEIPNQNAFSIDHPMWTTFSNPSADNSTISFQSGGLQVSEPLYNPTFIAWWQMPDLRPLGQAVNNDLLGRIALKGAVFQALPALSQSALHNLNISLHKPVISSSDQQSLIKASRREQRAAGYLNTDYIETKVSSETTTLPSSNGADTHLTASRSPASEPNDAFIEDYNQNAIKAFEAKVDAVTPSNTGDVVFANDGVPCQTITFYNNCQWMRFSYLYPLTSGGVMALDLLQQTPAALVPIVQADPYSHSFEKAYYAALETDLNNAFNALSIPALDANTLDDSRKLLKRMSLLDGTNAVDRFSNEMKLQLEDYLQSLQKWQSQQQKGRGRPFVPPAHGSPVLSHIATPFDVYQRITEALGSWQSALWRSPFGQLIKGHFLIDNRSGRQIADAIKYIDSHAADDFHGSQDKCATFVGDAIRSSGVPLEHIGGRHYAADMGPVLVRAGFRAVPEGSKLQPGDVAVITAYPGQNPPYGHAAIWDGKQWVSDFKQSERIPFSPYPGDTYRNTKPSFIIYRWPD